MERGRLEERDWEGKEKGVEDGGSVLWGKEANGEEDIGFGTPRPIN
jgi:hypothetical protein